MNRIVLLCLLIAFVSAGDLRCEDSFSELEPILGPVMAIQSIVSDTKFPITFRELHKKLGGDERLKWCCERGGSTAGVSRHLSTFRILGVEAPEGVDYQVEFEYKDISEDRGDDLVIRARVCVATPLGMFYADDLREALADPKEAEKSEANKPVETTSLARPEVRKSCSFATAPRSVSHG